MTFLKNTCQLFEEFSFNFELFDIFLRIKCRFYASGGKITDVMLSSQCVISGDTCCQLVPLLAVLTLIIWLRWCLPSFPLYSYSVAFCNWKCLSWDYVNIFLLCRLSSASFSIHWWFALINLLWWLANGALIIYVFMCLYQSRLLHRILTLCSSL